MPLNAETEAIIKELEQSGFDMNFMRTQANRNPLLEKAANAKLGGGILRHDAYTQYKQQKDEEVKNLQQQVRELAALKDSLPNFQGNDSLYEAALDRIETLESNMIADGWNKEDLEGLTFNEKAGLARMLNKAKEIDDKNVAANIKKEEEKKMPDKDNEQFLDISTFQTAAANLAGGNIVSAVKIQAQLRKAEKLGIEITPELEEKFATNLLSGLSSNKSYEQIADETFGFAAKEKEIQEKANSDLIEAKARELAAERIKELGLPESTARPKVKSIMDSYTGRLGANASDENAVKGEGGTVLVRGRQLPANKFGDPEFHKLRGDRATRVAHAINSMRELEGKRPELFDDIY